jgi:hypothetical protein
VADPDVWLRGVPSDADPDDVRLYPKPDTSSGFPTQFSGLRYFSGTVKELSLVAIADAPSGMGAVWRVMKNGTVYAVYIVETTDPNASGIRLRTSTGIKSARLKT